MLDDWFTCDALKCYEEVGCNKLDIAGKKSILDNRNPIEYGTTNLYYWFGDNSMPVLNLPIGCMLMQYI